MCFDIADLARRNPCRHMRRLNDRRLRLDRRGGVACLFRPVIVDRITPDHGNHLVAVRQRIFQPAQHHQTRTVAKHGASGIRIKRAAMTIG